MWMWAWAWSWSWSSCGLVVGRKFPHSPQAQAWFDAISTEATGAPEVDEPAGDNNALLVQAANNAETAVFATGDRRVLDWGTPGGMQILSPRDAWMQLFALSSKVCAARLSLDVLCFALVAERFSSYSASSFLSRNCRYTSPARTVLREFHQRPQHPVRGCGHVQRGTALAHMDVQKIDLAGFAAHQVLRGGGFRDCLLDADRQRRPALQALIP